jgi:hypothetical protein
VDLPVRTRPAQHGDDREQDNPGLTVDFALRATAVRDELCPELGDEADQAAR